MNQDRTALNLHQLRHLRRILVRAKLTYYRRAFGMHLHETVEISLTARFDRQYPKGVHVGANSYIALEAMILTHDRTRGLYLDTRVEENCFIGARSLLLPGITVGRGSIVGAGAVVTKDVPPFSMVAGNPARVIRSGIDTIEYGRLRLADQAGGVRGSAEAQRL